MLEYLVLGFLCGGGVVAVFFVIQAVLAEGAVDEVNFPLASCDTSMFDELKGDGVSQKDSVKTVDLPVEEVDD